MKGILLYYLKLGPTRVVIYMLVILQLQKRSMTFSGSLLNYNMVRSSIDDVARIHSLGDLFNLINNEIRSRAFAGGRLSFTMICFNF